jgi:hypothetical protein
MWKLKQKIELRHFAAHKHSFQYPQKYFLSKITRVAYQRFIVAASSEKDDHITHRNLITKA